MNSTSRVNTLDMCFNGTNKGFEIYITVFLSLKNNLISTKMVIEVRFYVRLYQAPITGSTGYFTLNKQLIFNVYTA